MALAMIIFLLAIVGIFLAIGLAYDTVIDQCPSVCSHDLYYVPYSEGRRLHNRCARLKRQHRALSKKHEKAASLARQFAAIGHYDRVAVLIAEADDAERRMQLLDQTIIEIERQKAQEKWERQYRALARRQEADYKKLTKEK